jgi:hypothetical protein
MLFGIISEDNLGTLVRGRAGSDLNGVAMFTILIPLMALIVIELISEGTASIRQLVIMAAVFIIGVPYLYWSAHKDKREAEPLVRFLRDTVTVAGRALRTKSAIRSISKAFTLNLDGEDSEGPVTPDAIHDALLRVGARDVVILESGPETYMQSAGRDGGFILEMREGDNQRHFRAIRRPNAPVAVEDQNDIFTFEEVCEAFVAYATEAPMPHFLIWERLLLAE